jgi:hypothetical protein
VIGGKKPYWVVNKRVTWFFILSHLLGGWRLDTRMATDVMVSYVNQEVS